MEKVNHLSEANTTALITGIGGLASQIIATKNSGGKITSAEQQIANLSEQTLKALGLATNPPPPPPPVQKGLTGTTMLLIGGSVFLLIALVLIYKFKK